VAFETLLVDVQGRIARLTINRPDKLNALNLQCVTELGQAFLELKQRDDVDVVIVTGAGEKAFVAGADIAEFATLDDKKGVEFARRGQAVFESIAHLGKPVIAAVNGFALGGGCELAMACHIRIASEKAKLGQPEVNLGIIPGYGGTQRLTHLVGVGKAFELVLTAAPIDAAEALRIGLVNQVVPAAELMATAQAMATVIASKAQPAVRHALAAVNATLEKPLAEGLRLEAELFGKCCATADAAEGRKAFLEKRKPNFTGR